jgi:hypothetical protein
VNGSGRRGLRLLLPVILLGLAAVLTACNNQNSTTLSATPTTNASLTLTLQKSPVGSILATGGGDTLYTYNLDVTPGMVTGQAIDQDGGLWFVINGKGQQLTTAFSVTSPNPNGNPAG